MGEHRSRMAVGKNKRLTKGKKGNRKKAVDPFTKKDWYDVKAPALFANSNIGKTLVTRTAGTKIASDGLKGRVFEVSLGDLNKSEDDAFRKIRLRVEDTQGKSCLTNFWGMKFTTDKLRSLVRKWQSLIEAHCDVMTKEVSTVELIKAVEKFIPEYIGKDIQKACEGIYPLQNVYIRKVKILKAAKFDAAKLAEIHSGDTGAETGAKIARNAEAEAAVTAE